MLTVCPKCALTLVVTAADLRAAQGYVRCGRCASVFNALARLTEDRPGTAAAGPAADTGAAASAGAAAGTTLASRNPSAAAAESGGAAPRRSPAGKSPPTPERPRPPDDTRRRKATTPAPPPAQAPAEEVTTPARSADDAIPEEALEFDADSTDVNAWFVEMPPNREWTAATGSFKALSAANQEAAAAEPGEVEIDAATLAAILNQQTPPSDPAAPQPASTADSPDATPPEGAEGAAVASPEEHEKSAQRAATPRHSGAHSRPSFQAATTRSPSAQIAETPTPEDEAPALATLLDELPGLSAGRATTLARRPSRLWWIGTGVAALALLVQIINHYRDDLAATARFHQPLTALYTALGVPLAPHWDLHAYDVHQLGAMAEHGPAGRITVRASIKNAAQQPQPLPLLRVTLEDRFGNRIAARDVAPRFYLPRTIPPSAFLSAGQRIDAEMGFVDPGANAVGFEIDACLPSSGGGVACANDSSTR